MLIVVVFPMVVYIVVLSVLLLAVLIVVSTGVVVLLYHLNLIYKATSTTYAIRGGYCNNSFYCGIFFVGLSAAFSNVDWVRGTALSFKLLINNIILY